MKKLRVWLPAVLTAGAFAVVVSGPTATATHEPADKVAATASSVDEINDDVVLLKETMRVSSTSDLILATSAECSILTSLLTNNDNPSARSFGEVELYLTIDGDRVPVQDSSGDSEPGGVGEVVFCNRAYARSVTDQESPADEIDEEDDYIQTRTANAFNWMAFDVGKRYDDDGDNVVDIELHGTFRKEPTACGEPGETGFFSATCADAFVGKRSLIIEAVHASNHESAIGG